MSVFCSHNGDHDEPEGEEEVFASTQLPLASLTPAAFQRKWGTNPPCCIGRRLGRTGQETSGGFWSGRAGCSIPHT